MSGSTTSTSPCEHCGGDGWYLRCLLKGRISPNQLVPCEKCNADGARPGRAITPPAISTEPVLAGNGRTVTVTTVCPNCDALMDERHCKLLCPTPGCGFRVTCSE